MISIPKAKFWGPSTFKNQTEEILSSEEALSICQALNYVEGIQRRKDISFKLFGDGWEIFLEIKRKVSIFHSVSTGKDFYKSKS